MKKHLLISTILSLLSFCVVAQDNFDIFQYRNVGPSRGGRVTAVAGIASEPSTYYMGATGGGVWKTTDFGITWKNVSDGYFETPSIGAIRVAQNDPNIVYVGTGSDGLRSNVITGKGMYKSVDAGKTWEHIGLKNSGHIGAVEIHPENHNIVYVAAIGQAFEANEERGVFKTTDGGKTWEKVLYISDKVGFTDVEFLPGNPNVVYASAWKAERKPWTIISGGNPDEGGIFKSVDGGKNWTKLSKGLPQGLIGKIDLAVCPADSKILYALVEAPDKEGGLYLSIDQGKSFKLVSNYGGIRTRPFYYTNVDVDPTNSDIVYVCATGYFKSMDGGKNWQRRRSPHGDNHDMWINPNNPGIFIQSNDGGANVTMNGGESWSTQYNQPTAEIYQVEVDDQYPYWLYGGQQDNYTTIAVPSRAPGAIQASDVGWILNTGGCETGPAVPKPGDHNIVYSNCKGRFGVFDKRTGVEKRYDVGAANMYGHNPKDLTFRFQRVSPIHVSPHNPNVIYHTSQYVHKTTDEGKTWEIISPDLTAFEPDKQVISGSPITRDITGEEFYSTIYAIRESPVKEGVIWVGANDGPVHVTKDGGANWDKVTPSKLPSGGRVDAVEPSPHNEAKAYISVLRYQLGDWKPYIYKTENYGKSWTLLTDGTNGIPADYPTRVVREDPNREGLLYAGTEFGLFMSMDDGKTWKSFQQNLPVTPVTDMKIFRNDLVISTMGRSFWILDNLTPLYNENFSALADSPMLFQPKDTRRFQFPMIRRSGSFPNYPQPAVQIDYYLPENQKEPIRLEIFNSEGKAINTFFSSASQESIEKAIENMGMNTILYSVNRNLKAQKGLHRFEWNMTHAGAWDKRTGRRYQYGPMVAPGKYTARLVVGEKVMEQSFELKMDPRLAESGVTKEDIVKQEKLSLELVQLLSEAKKTQNDLENMHKKLSKNQGLSEVEKEKLKAIEASLSAMVTEDGTYMQPKLIDQISYLYNVVSRGGSKMPNKDAYDRYAELNKQFEELKSSIDD